jgi:hypothetical protein
VNSIMDVGGGGILISFSSTFDGITRFGIGIGSAEGAARIASTSGGLVYEEAVSMGIVAIGSITEIFEGDSTIIDLEDSETDSSETTGVYRRDFIIVIPAALVSTSLASKFLK